MDELVTISSASMTLYMFYCKIALNVLKSIQTNKCGLEECFTAFWVYGCIFSMDNKPLKQLEAMTQDYKPLKQLQVVTQHLEPLLSVLS